MVKLGGYGDIIMQKIVVRQYEGLKMGTAAECQQGGGVLSLFFCYFIIQIHLESQQFTFGLVSFSVYCIL